jgi:putative FmdB family regulatory protein
VPIYEYRCLECGFQDEYLQKLSEPQLTVCPTCGKETFRKLLSAAGFQLKGSGWYATDFKNSGSKPGKSGGAAKPPEGKSESPGEAKSAESKSAEPKSESKSETKNEPAAA